MPTIAKCTTPRYGLSADRGIRKTQNHSIKETVMTRLMAVLVLMLLTGCAGVAVPIGSYEHARRDSDDNTIPTSPRDRATHFLKLWDESIQNIQHANSTAQASLPAIAGGAAYRVARSKSSPATAVLAAVGLYGTSVADSFVQLSRLNVYLEGIAALECATMHFDRTSAALMTREELLASLAKANASKYAAQLKTYDLMRGRLLERANLSLGLAVSRITLAANKALSGSIVSVQSQNYGSAFTFPAAPVQNKAPEGVDAADAPAPDPDLDRITAAMQRLETINAAAVEVSAAEIDKCQFGGTLATVENRIAALKIAPIPAVSGEVTLSATTPLTFLISGGRPAYKASAVPNANDLIVATVSEKAGIWTVAVSASGPLAPGKFTLVVVDDQGASAQQNIVTKQSD
jgi:hypothetical protein